MTETLRQKQSRFARNLPRLLDYAFSLGYEVTLGESYRTELQAYMNSLNRWDKEGICTLIEHQFPLLAKLIRRNGFGIARSLHTLRLAQDLQLFDKDGKWIQEPYPYTLLADFWEGLGPDHRAGVRWGDTPHFSIEHEGVK